MCPRPPDRSLSGAIFVNGFCLLGAIIGLCSVYLPWLGYENWSVSLADILGHHMADAVLAGALFLAGTFLALLFPIGGFVQLVGLLMFYRAALWPGEAVGVPSLGFFVALVSCGLVFAGLVRPTGPGFVSVQSRWSKRTETSARMRIQDGRVRNQRISSPREIIGVVRGHSVWAVSMLVAISAAVGLACAGVVGHEIGVDEREYVHISGNGVIVEFGNLTYTPAFSWNDTILHLGDGVNTVMWAVTSSLWGSDMGTTVSFEERNLSGLTVFPVIADSDRDGLLTRGDQVEFLVDGDGEFSEGCTYSALISRPAWALDVATVVLGFSFTMLPEDGIESEAELQIIGGMYRPPAYESEGWMLNLMVVAILFCSFASAYYVLVVAMRRIMRRRGRFD